MSHSHPTIEMSPPPVPLAALSSPFAPPVDAEEMTYGIVASGPAVAAGELETADAALDVMVLWGDEAVLHAAHLSPPRSFFVGEEGPGKGRAVDFIVGEAALGTDRLPVVLAEGDAVSLVIAEGASGTVTVGEHTVEIAELVSSGRTHACPDVPGAQQYALPAGATARMHHRDLTFVVKQAKAARKVAGASSLDRRPLMYVGGSVVLHAAFIVLFYFLPPHPASLSLDRLSSDSSLIDYVVRAQETEPEELVSWLENAPPGEAGGQGMAHRGEEGEMGDPDTAPSTGRYGVQGDENNQDLQLQRERQRQNARTAGILGALAAMSFRNVPTSPFGADMARGNDVMDRLGALMGDHLGENQGWNGLGLTGTGRGAGGPGEGTVGTGDLRTMGHGGGCPPDATCGQGYGPGGDSPMGRRRSRTPARVRPGGRVTVGDGLSAETIRRVIRRHLNEVRFCYEQGLQQRPDLGGRVRVGFIISPSGAVQQSVVSQSTLGHPRVESCIANAVRRWSFPAPSGVVAVQYPFMLTPPVN